MKKNTDFAVTFTCRHDECEEAFKVQSVEEIKKLSKYYAHIIDGAITVDHQNSTVKVDIQIHVPGLTIMAKEAGYSIDKVFDSALEHAKVQLKKLRDKTVDHRADATPPEPVEETEI